MSWLQSGKPWLIGQRHLAEDALHIRVARGLLFGSALLFGWKLSSWKPRSVVLAAALLGEA